MRYKVCVAYDGSNYSGWQKQENASSIQSLIEKALSTICNEEIGIVASGRTDAGVHAIAQIFHFDTELIMDENKWIYAMNGYLPKDIRIQSIKQVGDVFHARFDVISKRYDYYISLNHSNPFIQKYKTLITYIVDIDKMKEAAKLFIGEHDFTSFSSNKIHVDKSRVKRIDILDIIEEENGYHFIYQGNGFLRYMIRMITQTLLEVGRDRVSIEEVKDMLEHPSKEKCRYKAEPNGLYLTEVRYE